MSNKKRIKIKIILCSSLMSLVIAISVASGSWSQVKVGKKGVMGNGREETVSEAHIVRGLDKKEMRKVLL